jgi:hypothetical protein
VLKNISFEIDNDPNWRFRQGARRAGVPYPDPATSFSALLPTLLSGQRFTPILSQRFSLPNWLDNQGSSADLTLQKAVDQLINNDQAGFGSPEDKLFASLRVIDGSQVITLADKIEIANGAEGIVGPPAVLDDWTQRRLDLFANIANIEDYAGREVELTFSVPNPGPPDWTTTNFYLDKVNLEICTQQPVPVPETGKGSIEGQASVFINGTFRRIQGVQVWAYKVDGPVYATFTVNSNAPNPNYGFYNLEPGLYILYAQYVDAAGFTYTTTGSVSVQAGATTAKALTLDF